MDGNDNSDRDARIDLLAAEVASTGCTICQAAERIGVSETTGYRMAATPRFKRVKAERLIERADSLASRVIDAERLAVLTLVRLMLHGDDCTAGGAAKAILAHHSRIMATLDRQCTAASLAEAAERRQAAENDMLFMGWLQPSSDRTQIANDDQDQDQDQDDD